MEVDKGSHEASDEENEMNLLNSAKPRRVKKIVDSDSDSDNTQDNDESSLKSGNNVANDVENEELSSQEKSANTNKIKHRRIAIIDSDSESESNFVVSSQIENSSQHGDEERTDVRYDSEEEGDSIMPHNKSFSNEESSKEADTNSTTHDGELVSEETPIPSFQKFNWSSICDPESSDEERSYSHQEENHNEEPRTEPKAYRKKKPSKEKEPKKMTAQEAAKQKLEILSESQRRVREKNVSLPYHVPKSYTIKEFLQKRSRMASALPSVSKASPSAAIKMSKEQLLELSKKMNERIKEVEEFYKSESEEEEEEENYDDISKDIRSWLDVLVTNAVDTVEDTNSEIIQRDEDTNNDGDKSTEMHSSEQQEEVMDYEVNLDNCTDAKPDCEVTVQKPSIADLVKEKIANIQPRLSGGPDEVIDLDEGVTRPSEVKKLVEKFFQNAVKKVSHKHKVQLDVVEVSGAGEIVKETLSMNVDDEEEPAIIETPGAKLQRLREELQNQMALKRAEIWKQRQELGVCLDSEKSKDEKISDCQEDAVLDDEEEAEMTESSSEEEIEDDEDNEEYDVPEKPKSAFIDAEAEESDIEHEEENNELSNDEEDNGFDGDNEEIENENTNDSESQKPKKRTLKRVIKPFIEDSDEEEDADKSDDEIVTMSKEKRDICEDDIISPNLPRPNKTPQRQLERAKSEFDFLTPVTYLTGLQNLNSDSKFLKDSPVFSPLHMGPSPLKEINHQSNLQKKLFDDQVDSTQVNMEDLVELCSGRFPESQDQLESNKNSEELVLTTQDLLDVCSSSFSTTTKANLSPVVDSNNKNVDPKKDVINIQTNEHEEMKSLNEDDDQIISQLVDEAELESFKKKFDTPLVKSTRNNVVIEGSEVNATGLINSDDENEGLEIKKRKSLKKLVFSDDDDSDEEKEVSEEEIDLHDDIDNDSDDVNDQPGTEINYDSEENEVEEIRNLKPADFIENEAELSESDWDSADEDEKGLDDMEFELADKEKFDEDKVRSDLEKIHMRRLLDDDNREVKLLQEILLEDGELHGAGRQRQFRWRNIDSVGNDDEKRPDDEEDVYLDEEESEEQWRKMRHQREMFLKQKSETEDVESILSDSQVLKIGQEVIKKSQTRIITSQNNISNNNADVVVKGPLSLLNKRGSFLSRNDQVLQRVAEYNKVTNVVGNSAKNPRCFVFQTVESAEAVNNKFNNNKRKAPEGTPTAIKRMRLTNLSPAAKGNKPAEAKKLFGNW